MATSECQLQVDEHDIDTDPSIAMDVIADLTLDVVSPSHVTAGAEILLDISSENTS